MRPMTKEESEQRALYQKQIDQLLSSLYWEVPEDERPRVTQRCWKDEQTGAFHAEADRSMLCAEDRVTRSATLAPPPRSRL